MQFFKWGQSTKEESGNSINEKNNMSNGIGPKKFWKIGLKRQSMGNISNVLVFSFNVAILLGEFLIAVSYKEYF